MEPNISDFKIFLMTQKFYFDIGMSITSLLVKILMVVGIGAAVSGVDPQDLFYLGLLYGLCVYIIGLIYVKFGWYTAALEVDNRLNPFQAEVRNHLKKQNI